MWRKIVLVCGFESPDYLKRYLKRSLETTVRISLLRVNVVKSFKTLCVCLKVIANVLLDLADCCLFTRSRVAK